MTWCSRTDGLARGLPAKGFGFGGVQRERAYHDALLDLAAPAMGHPPVVRIAAVDGDGAAAYHRRRSALGRLVESDVAVDHRDVDRPAAAAADADLPSSAPRASTRPARCRTDANVVVRAVTAEHWPVGLLLNGGAAVGRNLALARPPHRDRCQRRRSQRGELAGEVGDQGVEHGDHHALAHRRGLAA